MWHWHFPNNAVFETVSQSHLSNQSQIPFLTEGYFLRDISALGIYIIQKIHVLYTMSVWDVAQMCIFFLLHLCLWNTYKCGHGPSSFTTHVVIGYILNGKFTKKHESTWTSMWQILFSMVLKCIETSYEIVLGITSVMVPFKSLHQSHHCSYFHSLKLELGTMWYLGHNFHPFQLQSSVVLSIATWVTCAFWDSPSFLLPCRSQRLPGHPPTSSTNQRWPMPWAMASPVLSVIHHEEGRELQLDLSVRANCHMLEF